MQLARIVGRLEINIQDSIPDDAGNVVMTFTNENHNYLISTGTPAGSLTENPVVGYVFKGSDVNQTNFRIGAYILNTVVPFDVTITSTSADGKPLANVLIPNVQVFKNKKTVLSGRLFGQRNPVNTGTEIGLDEEWDTELTTGF